MGVYNLDRIFRPKTIAVIGASEKENSIGKALMTNLTQGGFDGRIIPVNPKYSKVYGLDVKPDMSTIEHGVDLAVIATPISTVPDIIDQCASAGAGGAIIISAGGRESGDKGRDIERKIGEKARKTGLRIIGPNCLGIIHPEKKLNASFASGMPLKGSLAVVSQSGAICTSILDFSFNENIGFSHFVSIGAMLDADFGDMIDYLGNEPRARSILLYVESLTHTRKFMSAARAVSRVKPIIVLKAGRSRAGARAAASHTGAMAGEDDVYDAAFKRAGIVRVNTIEQLFDCAELMAKKKRPAGSRLAVITNGGGPGVMAADAMSDQGLEPAPLPDALVESLDKDLPPHWSRGNPIDIVGDATPERFRKTVEICLKSKAFDGVLAVMAPQALADAQPVAEALADLAKNTRFPLFASWMGGKRMAAAIDLMNRSEIPTYETPERAVQSFLFMVEYSRNLDMLVEIPPKLTRELTFDQDRAEELIQSQISRDIADVSETASKRILSAYGIPVNPTRTAKTEDDAVAMAEDMGFPVAVKLVSPDISHKTDANGVHLNLKSSEAVREAWQEIMKGARDHDPDARILGACVQQFIDKPDYELLIGAKIDASFGPVVLFGMGGIFTEIMQDRALGLVPLNRLLARRLMEKTRAYRLLKGFRNRPPADLEAIEELLIRLSQLMADFPGIAELDMNPVIVKDRQPVVVDARIRLGDPPAGRPNHLVISPYPEAYEFREATDDGQSVFIRPIKPEDVPLFRDLFKVLSKTSIYYRFFSTIKELSPAMLARFTQIDYDRQIALVALDEQDRMMAVARVIGDPDGKTGEFSILVGDPWHGRGIGGRLLTRVLQIAAQMGIETVWGLVLRDNRNMRALGEKLGFVERSGDQADEVELKLDLT